MARSSGSGGMAGAPANLYEREGSCVCARPVLVPWEAPLTGYRDVKCGRDVTPERLRELARGRS
jgi:hypothetical protein